MTATSDQFIGGAHGGEEASRQLGQKVARGVRWMGPTQVLVQVVRLTSSVALLRILEPSQVGVVSLVSVLVGLFDRVLGDTGMTVALIRHPRVSQAMVSSVLWWNLAIGATVSLVFVVASQVLAGLLGDPLIAPLVAAIGLTPFLNSFGFAPLALLRRGLAFDKVALTNLVVAATTAVGTIVPALAGQGEWSIVYGTLAGATVNSVLAWVFARWRPSLVFSRAELRPIRNFSINKSLGNLFGYLTYAGDRFIVGRFLGTTELGYYASANRLVRLPLQTTTQTYRDVIMPNLARIQDDHIAMGRAYRRSVGGIAFLLFPLCVTVAAVADPLVDVLLGAKWAPMSPLISLIALTGALQAVAATSGSIFTAKGRADQALYWQIGSSLFILSFYLAGATFGVEGVAWAYLLGTLALVYPAVWIPLLLIDVSPLYVLRPTVGPALAAAAGGLAAAGTIGVLENRFDAPSLVQLIVGLTASGVIYALYIVVARPEAYTDLVKVVRRKKGKTGKKKGRKGRR